MSDTTSVEKTKPRPGYTTTEFWLSTAAAILGALFASGAIGEGGTLAKVLGMAATILSTLGYMVARTKAKA